MPNVGLFGKSGTVLGMTVAVKNERVKERAHRVRHNDKANALAELSGLPATRHFCVRWSASIVLPPIRGRPTTADVCGAIRSDGFRGNYRSPPIRTMSKHLRVEAFVNSSGPRSRCLHLDTDFMGGGSAL